MTIQDSPTGQQFHIRYDHTYANGTTRTLWSLVFDTRAEAEREQRAHVKWKDGDVRIFVRDVSPWREDH